MDAPPALAADRRRPVGSDPALEPLSTRSLLVGYGPRFFRDAFGPVLAFYVGMKLGGVALGIAVSTVVSFLGYRFERRRGRRGLMARLSLGFVVVNAAVGLVSDSATVYLALPVLQSAAFGLGFLLSAAMGLPLTGLLAQEMRPIPPEVVSSRTYRKVFGKSSVVWGIYLLVRSAIRLVTLSTGSLGAFVVVNFITGLPLTAALVAWSIRAGVRGFRRSEEWGPAIAELERGATHADPSRDATIASESHAHQR
jgi:Protein of unknown function (DUF3159)